MRTRQVIYAIVAVVLAVWLSPVASGQEDGMRLPIEQVMREFQARWTRNRCQNNEYPWPPCENNEAAPDYPPDDFYGDEPLNETRAVELVDWLADAFWAPESHGNQSTTEVYEYFVREEYQDLEGVTGTLDHAITFADGDFPELPYYPVTSDNYMETFHFIEMSLARLTVVSSLTHFDLQPTSLGGGIAVSSPSDHHSGQESWATLYAEAQANWNDYLTAQLSCVPEPGWARWYENIDTDYSGVSGGYQARLYCSFDGAVMRFDGDSNCLTGPGKAYVRITGQMGGENNQDSPSELSVPVPGPWATTLSEAPWTTAQEFFADGDTWEASAYWPEDWTSGCDYRTLQYPGDISPWRPTCCVTEFPPCNDNDPPNEQCDPRYGFEAAWQVASVFALMTPIWDTTPGEGACTCSSPDPDPDEVVIGDEGNLGDGGGAEGGDCDGDAETSSLDAGSDGGHPETGPKVALATGYKLERVTDMSVR